MCNKLKRFGKGISIKKILIVFGTRPEAIKLAPVIKEFKKNAHNFETITASTGQHREILEQVLDVFDVAVANGKVHIVWVHEASSQSEVYYRSFNGSTGSNVKNVSQTSGDAYNPQVVAYQNNAYIVWEEDKNKDYSSDEIYYRRFNGSSWSTVKNVSETSSSESDEPSVSVDGGKVRITWTENISGNREIFYRSFSP